VKSSDILAEFFNAIMNWKLAVGQKSLERELGRFREAARLGKRQTFLPEERQRQLELQLGLADMSRGEDFVWNGNRHVSLMVYRP
jgi:hypothetical protein